MTPEKVLNAVYEQLAPLVAELAKYHLPNTSVIMDFGIGTVRFEFNNIDNNEEN